MFFDVQVEADSGDIGGLYSHEYHLLNPLEEDAVQQCVRLFPVKWLSFGRRERDVERK